VPFSAAIAERNDGEEGATVGRRLVRARGVNAIPAGRRFVATAGVASHDGAKWRANCIHRKPSVY